MVDVLRAGTTIATALANGARAVLPVETQGDAGRLRAHLDDDVSVFAGERDGVILSGYACDASPLSFSAQAVERKTVVLLTSNGTPAIVRSRGAERVVVAALVNAHVVAERLRSALEDGGATIVCAGHQGRIAVEDVLCAGLLVDRVVGGASTLGDGSRVAHGLYRGAQGDLARALMAADRTHDLVRSGHADDVAACARLDTLEVVPVYQDNRLVAG